MKKVVIFDLDGTTLNTIEGLMGALNYGMSEMGFPKVTKEEMLKSIGNGLVQLVIRTAKTKDEEIIKKVVYLFIDYYKKHLFDNTYPFDGIIELLKDLKDNNIQTFILSNKDDFAVKLLSDYFFGYLIDDAVGHKENGSYKPDPVVVDELLKENNVTSPIDEIVYVGDSMPDALTAKNYGMDCIICSWGYGNYEELRNEKIVNSVAELKDAILNN